MGGENGTGSCHGPRRRGVVQGGKKNDITSAQEYFTVAWRRALQDGAVSDADADRAQFRISAPSQRASASAGLSGRSIADGSFGATCHRKHDGSLVDQKANSNTACVTKSLDSANRTRASA